MVLVGGPKRQSRGWVVLVPLIFSIGLLQIGAVATVAWVLKHDQRFFKPWWEYGSAWKVALTASVVCTATAMSLGCTSWWFGEEMGNGGGERVEVDDEEGVRTERTPLMT